MKQKGLSVLLIVIMLSFYSSASALMFGFSEYELTSGDITWAQAQSEAVLWGGNLVTINDSAEQAWLTVQYASVSNPFIGMNDLASEGDWVWSSGEPVTYTNWAPGEPNNWLGVEDIAVMNWGSAGSWNDLPTPTISIGIMERTAGQPVPEPATMLLIGTGLVGLVGSRLRKKK